jgi:hypothetical protein
MTVTTEQPQHVTALEKANRIHRGRAELKRRVGRGEIAIADILDPSREVPLEAQSMTLLKLLCAQHRWGPQRARRAVLRPLGISEVCPVDALTNRQRKLVIEALHGRAQAEVGR